MDKSIGFVKRRWFLLLLAAGGGVLWLRPDWLNWCKALAPHLVVAPALFLTAWSLKSRSLYQTILRPLPALWAVLISYGLVPILGWSAGPLLDEDYRIGLIISASVPCTLASAVIWTRLAGGNEATALFVTLLTTCTSWLATTAWLLWATGIHGSVNSATMMRDLFLILVLPVVLGQLLRAAPPLARTADRFQTWFAVATRLLIFLIILKAAREVLLRLEKQAETPHLGQLLLAAGVCVSVHLLALAVGFYSSKILRFDRPDQIAVAFASSQKTLPVALYLFDVYYQTYPLAVASIVFYHVGQLVVDTFIAEEWAGRGNEEPRALTDANV